MTDEELVEQLNAKIGAVVALASNYPEAVQSRMLGQDTAPLREKVVAAALAVFREHTAWDDENACPWNCGLPHEHTEGRGADPYYYREHTAPTDDERGEAESDEPCACGHPRDEHDYGAGECYLSGCKCRTWEAATDDHEALVEVMTAATFVDGERRLAGWGPIADAILAAGTWTPNQENRGQ